MYKDVYSNKSRWPRRKENYGRSLMADQPNAIDRSLNYTTGTIDYSFLVGNGRSNYSLRLDGIKKNCMKLIRTLERTKKGVRAEIVWSTGIASYGTKMGCALFTFAMQRLLRERTLRKNDCLEPNC